MGHCIRTGSNRKLAPSQQVRVTRHALPATRPRFLARPAGFLRAGISPMHAAQLTPTQLTYGIEEEYFLVHAATGELVESAPDSFLRACRARFGEGVSEELHRAQVEM